MSLESINDGPAGNHNETNPGSRSLLAAGILTVAVVAQQAAPRPTANDVTVEKVKDNFYVLRGGAGGNTAAFITANGVGSHQS
jgi:hypothetical protein